MLDLMPVSKTQIFGEIAALLSPKTVVKRDEPLAKKTTLRVGGPADIYVEPCSEAELAKLISFCGEHNFPFMMLGRGSNLLIRDGGIRGLVISLAHPTFSQIKLENDRLHCGAGARLKAVSVEARRNHLASFEFLEGIPGSVGGALRMNAGAMGSAMFKVVERVRYMDLSGEIHDVSAEEIKVDYRSCSLLKQNIALGAVLKGEAANAAVVLQTMNSYNQKRWDSQPAKPSAGCIFKNTLTIPAGKLVDELGMKGTRVGGAAVSDVHGNFIVNEGNAKAKDVLELIGIIKSRALNERGIELHTEVEIVGED